MRDNHNRRNRFRTGGRSFRRNGSPNNHINRTGLTSFDRSRSNLRGNQNPSRLLEKYSNLAKEALSSGDKILSENYLQHADHFTRILNERESFRRGKYLEIKSENNSDVVEENVENTNKNFEKNLTDSSDSDTKIQKLLNLK